ncbi:MAG: GNAT family N-acetyltransferase [Chloroflexota bacterium]|nr:GNAT family N-acetyltransferase [Chloroflexota bacterium]
MAHVDLHAAEISQRGSGTLVRIRRAGPEDVVLILAMHDRLSADTIHARYFSSYTPSYEEIERICHLQPEEGAAWVAVAGSAGEMVVGIAYYMITHSQRPIKAEVAFLVEDAFQGQGVGQRLFRHLSSHALAQGIHSLHAYVDASNRSMMRVFARGGFPYTSTISYGLRDVQMLLDPGEAKASRRWVIPETITMKWPGAAEASTYARAS